jgi:ketosteroid isomerase-like protein
MSAPSTHKTQPFFIKAMTASVLCMVLALSAGCSSTPPGSASGVSTPLSAAAEKAMLEQARARLNEYETGMRTMDFEAVGNLFGDDGELSHVGGKVLTGSGTIGFFLNSFRALKIKAYALTLDSALVVDGAVVHNGSFSQAIDLPNGTVFEAKGRFESRWVKNDKGIWMLAHFRTRPAAPAPSGTAPS